MLIGDALNKISEFFMKKEFLDYWAELNWKNRFKWQSHNIDFKTIMRWVSLE